VEVQGYAEKFEFHLCWRQEQVVGENA